MKFKNDKLINDLLPWFHKAPTMPENSNFKRIHCDFEETRPSRVENYTKTVISRFLSQASMGLILLFT